MPTTAIEFKRRSHVRAGLRLEYLTLGYNLMEAVVALATGALASSVALIGFGVDSFIECCSGAVMLWQLRRDTDQERRVAIETRARKLIAISFFVLALYVGWEASEAMLTGVAPEKTVTGVVLAIASVIVMPVLARAKRRVGRDIGSAAMIADSRQTELCSWLSAILLAGVGLNALLGWWWADPVSALAMVPIIVREGVNAWQGKGCGCSASGTCH